MNAIDWIRQAQKSNNKGKSRFVRQKLIDALETMTDEQLNTLCRDIMLFRAASPDATSDIPRSPDRGNEIP
ncbi:hypothetical protein [Polluticoccus soli]|uniref:hypothetical protein n=1 Tax=Polluticoccus soli TaxID=3034150 RepID=UPI0023E14965|nr:hypothetical protein [Flavipsychrobacter sp. JY13-12]